MTDNPLERTRGPPAPRDVVVVTKRRGESMLELCPVGSKTDRPCPRLATTEPQGRERGGRKLCEVHAALKPLEEEIEDLGAAEELLEGWIEEARRLDNASLEMVLRHAREEMSARLEFLEEGVDAVHTTQR
jgi:hypothetical protein